MSEGSREAEQEADSRTAVAEYVAIAASRLSRMATAHRFPLLAKLLDQAVLEAWEEASRGSRRLRKRRTEPEL